MGMLVRSSDLEVRILPENMNVLIDASTPQSVFNERSGLRAVSGITVVKCWQRRSAARPAWRRSINRLKVLEASIIAFPEPGSRH